MDVRIRVEKMEALSSLIGLRLVEALLARATGEHKAQVTAVEQARKIKAAFDEEFDSFLDHMRRRG